MQAYTRIATPRFRRITFRIIGFEIELRASAPVPAERPSREERAMRRARAEELITRQRDNLTRPWNLRLY